MLQVPLCPGQGGSGIDPSAGSRFFFFCGGAGNDGWEKGNAMYMYIYICVHTYIIDIYIYMFIYIEHLYTG